MGPEVLVMPARQAAALAGEPRPVVRLWYPGDTPAQRRRPRIIVRGADSSQLGLPLAQGAMRFPVLIYSPSWPGTAVDNRALICNLASHGFVVASLSYPFRFSGMSEADFRQMVGDLEAPPAHTSAAAHERTVRRATSRVRFRAADVIAMIDGFANLNAADPRFADRLNLEQAGVFGFSLGGAVAAEAAALEPRFRAAANLDGRHWGTALERGVTQPYLFMGQELLEPTAADLVSSDPERRYNALLDRHDYAQLERNLRRNAGIQVAILGAEHEDFTDLPLRARLRHWRRRSKTPALRTAAIVNAIILGFFQQTLLNRPSPLLQGGANPYPEVRLKVAADRRYHAEHHER